MLKNIITLNTIVSTAAIEIEIKAKDSIRNINHLNMCSDFKTLGCFHPIEWCFLRYIVTLNENVHAKKKNKAMQK